MTQSVSLSAKLVRFCAFFSFDINFIDDQLVSSTPFLLITMEQVNVGCAKYISGYVRYAACVCVCMSVCGMHVCVCVCVCECMVMRVLYRKYRIYLRERETY